MKPSAFNQRVAIGDAIADVAVAARRVATEQVDQVRDEFRDEFRWLLKIIACGALATVLLGGAFWILASAMLQLLSTWMPTLAAAAIIATPPLVVGGLAGLAARRQLLSRRAGGDQPRLDSEPSAAALPAESGSGSDSDSDSTSVSEDAA